MSDEMSEAGTRIAILEDREETDLPAVHTGRGGTVTWNLSQVGNEHEWRVLDIFLNSLGLHLSNTGKLLRMVGGQAIWRN